jgi:hypothetical protein
MNYFFSFKNKNFISKLTIPKFKNKSKLSESLNLYSLEINKEKWIHKKIKCDEDDDFFYLKDQLINNDAIYFISQKIISDINENSLEILDNYTDTEPAFRSNFYIKNLNGGFSSYQSEYPFEMTRKKGNILSPVDMLLSKDNEKNSIIFKNIYHKPVRLNFYAYLIDYKKKKILEKYSLKTNHTNFINIEKKFINKNVFFFTSDYIGIPIFLGERDSSLSLEHTHPLHLYLLGKKGFTKIRELKEEFKKICNIL